MKKSIFKRIVSVALALVMCLSLIVSTGVMSASAVMDLYVRGGFNGWGADDSNKMSTTDGVDYTL